MPYVAIIYFTDGSNKTINGTYTTYTIVDEEPKNSTVAYKNSKVCSNFKPTLANQTNQTKQTNSTNTSTSSNATHPSNATLSLVSYVEDLTLIGQQAETTT